MTSHCSFCSKLLKSSLPNGLVGFVPTTLGSSNPSASFASLKSASTASHSDLMCESVPSSSDRPPTTMSSQKPLVFAPTMRQRLRRGGPSNRGVFGALWPGMLRQSGAWIIHGWHGVATGGSTASNGISYCSSPTAKITRVWNRPPASSTPCLTSSLKELPEPKRLETIPRPSAVNCVSQFGGSSPIVLASVLLRSCAPRSKVRVPARLY